MKNKELVNKKIQQLERAKTVAQRIFKERWDLRTPVRSGTLQRGNTVTIGTSQFEFTNAVPYFEYVENGTPTMAPVGMLRTTVLEANEIWKKSMKEAK